MGRYTIILHPRRKYNKIEVFRDKGLLGVSPEGHGGLNHLYVGRSGRICYGASEVQTAIDKQLAEGRSDLCLSLIWDMLSNYTGISMSDRKFFINYIQGGNNCRNQRRH